MLKNNLCKPGDGFLGIDQNISYEESEVLIIPFGLEKSVSYQGGTKNGPRAIIEASKELELFDEEFWLEVCKKIKIQTLQEPKISDNLESALSQLESIVESSLEAEKFPLVLGGEHSITCGAIRPFVKKYNQITLLHFDAHADLRDGYMGQKYSHASAIRRCLDYDNVNVISFGIRNISQSEIPFFEANPDRIKIFWAKDQKNWDLSEAENLLAGKNVYLTFDVDGFDASLMPATGTPEPGGLFWQETMEIISRCSKVCNIVGADVNELAPIKGMHSCDFLAAKLVYKILAHSLLKL